MIKAILFDRDGVIVDSEVVNSRSADGAFRRLGIVMSEEDKKYVSGKHPIDYVDYFDKKYSFDKNRFLKIQKDNYYKLFEKVKLIDGVEECVKRLQKNNYRLAVVTSSHLDSTNTVLAKAGLENMFEVLITFDDCNKRKPSPEPYLRAVEKLGLEADECLAVEDSPSGIKSAKKAGCYCVAITTTYPENELQEADVAIDNFDELKIDFKYRKIGSLEG